jgi:uncharacterized phage protein gp47/JayE
MVYRPRTQDEIYTSLRDGLTGRIERLTNFVETSFNYIWTQAFSQRFRENEVALLASQLSGWVEYAGGPITQEDLDALGVEGVDPDEVNEYMRDEDLDNLVEIVGVDRGQGEPAIGEVTFTTVNSFTEIPEGTSVATQPDGDGDFFEYTTNETVDTDTGDTEVSVAVTAIEVGEEYNVGSGQLTYLPSPPTGVQGVSNTEAITGGANIETNEELRSRAKQAIFDTSGGGTAAGVEGFVRSNTEDVTSVAVAEYPDGNASLAPTSPSPGGPGGSSSTTPFADVIVEGGETSDIQDSINTARPVAIQHNLVRPALVELNISIDVVGSNISTDDVQSAIRGYIDSRGLNEPVYRDVIIQRALNADAEVKNIEGLTIEVSDEPITYSSGTDVYTLRKGVEMENDGIRSVTGELNNSTTEFVEGSDYDESDEDGDTSDDSINWGIGGNSPDDNTDFFVTYEIADDIPIDEYEKADASSVLVTVV